MGLNLGSIIATARNAITPLNEVMGAKAGAQAQANKDQIGLAIQSALMQRQMQDDALKRQLMQAQAGAANATAAFRQHEAERPVPDPVAQHDQERDYDVQHPLAAPKQPTPFPVVQAQEGIFERRPDGLYDVATGKRYTGGTLHPVSTQPTFTPVTVGGQNGQPAQIEPFNTRSGKAGAPIGDAKPAGGLGSSVSLSPDDRAKMLAQAKKDDAVMTAYENNVMQSGRVPGTFTGTLGALSGAHGGAASEALGVLANGAVGSVDPAYQAYLTAQQSYGRIMGNLQSKRYTDHQAQIEQSISGLRGNDLNSTIQYKQQLRHASLADPTIQAVGPSASSGNIDLRTPAPKASRAPKKDYGPFGSSSGGDE